MSILRPQQAASVCEEMAVYMTRQANLSTGETRRFFKEQAKVYQRRRDRFVREYGIVASPITSTEPL